MLIHNYSFTAVKTGDLNKAINAINTWADPNARDSQGTALNQGKLIIFD